MKNSKLTRALIIILLLIILALGITALVFFLMNRSNVTKLNNITDEKNAYETQIAEKDLKIAELEQAKLTLEGALEEASKDDFSNFVFDYSKYSTDSIRVTERPQDNMGISVHRNLDGNMEMCVFDGTYIPNYSGEVTREYKEVEGLYGKVSQYYVMGIGNGINPQVLFLLQDGTVQFLDTAKLAQGKFVIGGTLDSEKVVRILQVNVGYSGAGGHIAIATVDKNGNLKVYNELK